MNPKKRKKEKEEVTTDSAEIQRIIREYYEQLYGNKIDNGRNGQILRKVQFSKTEPGRNRNYEPPNYNYNHPIQLQLLKLKL